MHISPELLEKMVNLRDAGIYSCGQGCTLKSGMLYRGGEPEPASRRDTELLLGLGLSSIIDLRPGKERKKCPPALAHIHRLQIEVDITGKTMSRLKPYLNRKGKESEIRGAVASVYADMAEWFRPHWPALFSHLSQEENWPVLIHCRAGKDRTGVTVALLQKLCGVSDEDVMSDYLMTNDYLMPRAIRMFRRINLLAFGLLPLKNYGVAYAAHPIYLDAFFRKIKESFSDPENYLLKSGVREDQLQSVRAILKGKPG